MDVDNVKLDFHDGLFSHVVLVCILLINTTGCVTLHSQSTEMSQAWLLQVDQYGSK